MAQADAESCYLAITETSRLHLQRTDGLLHRWIADYSEWSNKVQPIFSAALSGVTSIDEALSQAEEVSESFEN